MTMKSGLPASRRLISTATRLFTFLFIVAAALVTTFGRPLAAHRARLSLDLEHHLSRGTLARTRVIVRGADLDVDAIAARHHVQVVRRVANGAVVLANSVELDDL